MNARIYISVLSTYRWTNERLSDHVTGWVLFTGSRGQLVESWNPRRPQTTDCLPWQVSISLPT